MITAEQLGETFGPTWIRRVPHARLPAGVRNASVRRVLTEVGLPPGILDIVMIDQEITSGPPSLSAVYARYGKEARPHLADLFKIAQFGAGSACLDGTTGQVGLVVLDRPDLAPLPINTSLEHFVRFLHDIERERQAVEEDEEFAEHARELTDRLTMLDPAVMGDSSPWPQVIGLALDESRW